MPDRDPASRGEPMRTARWLLASLVLAFILALHGCGAGGGRTPVSSSAMRSVGYDAGERVLEIEFPNGDLYRYFDVPESVYDGLMDAESRGTYCHRNIRGRGYRYERVGE